MLRAAVQGQARCLAHLFCFAHDMGKRLYDFNPQDKELRAEVEQAFVFYAESLGVCLSEAVKFELFLEFWDSADDHYLLFTLHPKE